MGWIWVGNFRDSVCSKGDLTVVAAKIYYRMILNRIRPVIDGLLRPGQNGDTGDLQGDPSAPFIFIICLDYALRNVLLPSDGLTLKLGLGILKTSRRSPTRTCLCRWHRTPWRPYQESRTAVTPHAEMQTQSIGLFLKAEITKYVYLNPSSKEIISSLGGQQVEMVDE